MTKKYIYFCRFEDGASVCECDKKKFINLINVYKNKMNINHLNITVSSLNNYFYKSQAPKFMKELTKELYADKFKELYNIKYPSCTMSNKTKSLRLNMIAVEYVDEYNKL